MPTQRYQDCVRRLRPRYCHQHIAAVSEVSGPSHIPRCSPREPTSYLAYRQSFAVRTEQTALLCSSTAQSDDRHGVSAVMARPDDAVDEHHTNGQAPGGSAEPLTAAEGRDTPESSAVSNGQHAASEAGAAAASDGAALAADPVSAAAALAERSVSEPSSASEHPPSSRGGPSNDGPRGGPRRGNTQKPPADLVPAEEIWFRRGDIVAGRVIWASNQGARIELLKNPRIHGCAFGLTPMPGRPSSNHLCCLSVNQCMGRLWRTHWAYEGHTTVEEIGFSHGCPVSMRALVAVLAVHAAVQRRPAALSAQAELQCRCRTESG